MKPWNLLLIVFLLTSGCNHEQNTSRNNGPSTIVTTSSELNKSSSYEDGNYCADVEYSNPHTGRNSSYELNVDVENGEVVKINFPSGGWIDSYHIQSGGEIDEDGNATIERDNGYEYAIHITNTSPCTYSTIARQCLGFTRSGKRCLNKTDNEDGYCWEHEYQHNHYVPNDDADFEEDEENVEQKDSDDDSIEN